MAHIKEVESYVVLLERWCVNLSVADKLDSVRRSNQLCIAFLSQR
jgi:hypothetical protein